MRKYTVVLHPAEEGGYWADIPALPGCYSQGETVEETLANVREAIEAHLQALQEEGREIPQDCELVVREVEIAVV